MIIGGNDLKDFFISIRKIGFLEYFPNQKNQSYKIVTIRWLLGIHQYSDRIEYSYTKTKLKDDPISFYQIYN